MLQPCLSWDQVAARDRPKHATHALPGEKTMKLVAVCAALVLSLLFTSPAAAQEGGAEEMKKHVALAQEEAKAKKFDAAIEHMRKAVELAPRNDQFLGFLSDLEMKANRFADGTKHALEAIKLNDRVGDY